MRRQRAGEAEGEALDEAALKAAAGLGLDTEALARSVVRLKTVTLCPVLARCPAMGNPMAPSPIKAIRLGIVIWRQFLS